MDLAEADAPYLTPRELAAQLPAKLLVLTPCEIPPTADIKCWQARRDRDQKCRRARRDRGQFGGEPAVGAGHLCQYPACQPPPPNIKGWRARRGAVKNAGEPAEPGGIADQRTVCLFKLRGFQ